MPGKGAKRLISLNRHRTQVLVVSRATRKLRALRRTLVLIEFDADLPDGLATRPYWRFNAQLSEESHRFFAEHLLNNRPQMRASSATRKVATLTKQMKIGLCEQVRVN